MTRPRIAKWVTALAAGTLAGGMLLAQPAVSGSQQAEASKMQFYITSVEPGYGCAGCCTTGYCCDVPIDRCQQGN
ncbi:MAG TPA: hypothetical protein VFQ45_10645 [Longimicrobium sp.]|nr:hypothetical protein [Longimicrobium sp.]